ncbi:MAG: alpha/beta hydrolase [Bacteroidota bacterium]
MKTIQSSLHHRVIPPRNSALEKHPTIIMLHGRGADEEDLPGLADYLDDRMLVISPRAPYPFSFGGGYMWYEFNGVGSPDPTMFRTSHDKLQTFVSDCLAQYPIDPKRLYLLGFSMGTVMSHALALTQPELFRGVIANSGYVAEGTMLTYHWDKLGHMDVFVAHGTQDPVIPIQFGRRTHELYAGSLARLTYNEYPIGHQISQEELDDMARWLSQSLTQTP